MPCFPSASASSNWVCLRAIGLSVEQMRSGLTAELACLTLTGILAGTW
jgi:hypothetical protein